MVRGTEPSIESSAEYYDYHRQAAVAALEAMFDGSKDMADAHVDVAAVLRNTRDWRLQCFIAASEERAMETVDGTLTDMTNGAVRRRMNFEALDRK